MRWPSGLRRSPDRKSSSNPEKQARSSLARLSGMGRIVALPDVIRFSPGFHLRCIETVHARRVVSAAWRSNHEAYDDGRCVLRDLLGLSGLFAGRIPIGALDIGDRPIGERWGPPCTYGRGARG